MLTSPPVLRNLSHWGAFRATVKAGRLVAVQPFEHDPNPNPAIEAWVEMLYSPLRVARPAVRRGWLKGDGGAARGADEFVEIPWDEALDHVAGEIARIRRDHGAASIFGGSYGWSSAGRIHHARTLLRRFMNLGGGHTDQVNNYSYGAAMVFLPRILGRPDMIGSQLTDARVIEAETDLILAFGGITRKPWANQSGGAGEHDYDGFMRRITKKARLVNISPRADDIDPNYPCDWLGIRPGTDTALLLALSYEVIALGGADRGFLARYTEGMAVYEAYLNGESDGQRKDAAWAATITGLSPARIRDLAQDLIGKRVLLTAAWALQRAESGEQPYWAIVALAAILGQIGLPGGGFGFGYGSSGGMGNPAYAPPLWELPKGKNPAKSEIPVARMADMLLNPGGRYPYDGKELSYPDIRMIYWAGGNPFMHHQDLNRLRAAFRRPETVVVNECFWTATARHADIVLPATTTLERNDIGGSSRDPWLLAMHKLVEPLGEARNDFDIFASLAKRLGYGESFTEGLDEDGLLARAWASIAPRLEARGMKAPSLEEFWQMGALRLSEPDAPRHVTLADYRADPDAKPLATPSGKIEIFSQSLKDEARGQHPGHPAWLPPEEYLGRAGEYPLHLISPQPEQRLHGQLDGSRYGEGFKAEGREYLGISAADAAARGIREGDPLRVFNGRGACHAVARIDPHLIQGVVTLPTGASYDPDGQDCRNSNPNVLTQDIGSSAMTQGCAAQSCLVEVTRITALPKLRAYQPPVFAKA